MQTIIQQIAAIDGVIGCCLYNDKGSVIAAVCPMLLDQQQLTTAAVTILDCIHALQISDNLITMELRFSEGRMMIRPLNGGFINVLCSKAVNFSMVNITLNLAMRKIEQLMPKPGQEPAPVSVEHDGLLLLRVAHLKQGDIGSSFDQLGMVAVSQATAKQMNDFFGKNSKKIKVTTASGKEGTFPVMIINDMEMQYDSALVVGPGIERKLKVEEGAKVYIALA